MAWPTVKPAGTLAKGTYNIPGNVQDMSRNVQAGISEGAFNFFPKENKPSGNRGGRTEPLGSFQTGHPVLGKQNYDVRFNVHICKELILLWGRNAYTSDSKKGGSPIAVSTGGQTLLVFCHIDITTPRDNMLWHGVEGPHIVVEGFKKVGDQHPNRSYKPKSSSLELTPSDVFNLYVWERDNNAGKAMNDPTRSWPEWLKARIAKACLIG